MPRFLPIANPPNRFSTTSLSYDDGEAPLAELEIHEDQAKSILATNDSPDVGFRWSVNPYRGCQHACAYCLSGDTLILMADGRVRALRDVRVGDAIYGTYARAGHRRYTRTTVLAHWQTFKRAYRIVLTDGTEIVASADHRLLTRRGWRYVATEGGEPRPHLTVGSALVGAGGWVETPFATTEYVRGYLTGMVHGGVLRFEAEQRRSDAGGTTISEFRLATTDLDAVRRTRTFLEALTASRRRLAADGSAAATDVRPLLDLPNERRPEWARGFLAGVFDAEGSFGRGVLRVWSPDPAVLAETRACLELLAFDGVAEAPRANGDGSVRIRGGLRQHLRFFQLVDPAIRRKLNLEGASLATKESVAVAAITEVGAAIDMFDITTGTGDFIANGVVSHNCYARPSHEYLSFGAGTDFERKIVVKPRAPELLRAAFDKKSWLGELVVFSGVTDCYQPVESKLRLTRGCLEVCAEYRNPVGIITKSPVIERDVDVLQELVRVAGARVTVSVPFWDPDVAKAMEPVVTTPERRMKIVETLARAGIPVGVSVAPIVPGLNDEHLGDVLERARDAGATYAFYVLLRLPGPVKDVFEERMRKHLPLRAEKVFRRLREAHGGKLYNAEFGARGRGNSPYTDAIRILFERTVKRCGLASEEMEGDRAPNTFRRPGKAGQTSFDF